MPRKDQGWITFQTSEEEKKILEEFCQHSQRTKTEILRELVRGLNKESPPPDSLPPSRPNMRRVTEDIRNPNAYAYDAYTDNHREVLSEKKSLKVSSRNILKGVVKRVVTGAVNSEVTLEIVHKVELTSIITKVSAEELELVEGGEAYAVIKSNDIVIARE
ncbi:MAG: molybdopterin-binding protein [Rhizonema sp. PD37]|nr:molybdopterin-binding protein [Rhizonema sp. PD37]